MIVFALGLLTGLWIAWVYSLEQKRKAFLREVRKVENWDDPRKTPRVRKSWYHRVIYRSR